MTATLDTWTTRRFLYQSRLERAIARATGSRGELALLYVDLDRLAQVNHAMGKELADQVLAQAATRIGRALGPRAVRGRLAADDFLGLVAVADFDAAAALAGRLLEECRRPYVVDCLSITVTASIGFALFPSQSDDAASLLGRAEHCLFRAKIAGRNCCYPGATCSGSVVSPARTG